MKTAFILFISIVIRPLLGLIPKQVWLYKSLLIKHIEISFFQKIFYFFITFTFSISISSSLSLLTLSNDYGRSNKFLLPPRGLHSQIFTFFEADWVIIPAYEVLFSHKWSIRFMYTSCQLMRRIIKKLIVRISASEFKPENLDIIIIKNIELFSIFNKILASLKTKAKIPTFIEFIVIKNSCHLIIIEYIRDSLECIFLMINVLKFNSTLRQYDKNKYKLTEDPTNMAWIFDN